MSNGKVKSPKFFQNRRNFLQTWQNCRELSPKRGQSFKVGARTVSFVLAAPSRGRKHRNPTNPAQ